MNRSIPWPRRRATPAGPTAIAAGAAVTFLLLAGIPGRGLTAQAPPGSVSAEVGDGAAIGAIPRGATGYVGQVTATIDLVDNRTVPGEATLPQQLRPNQAFDSVSGNVFVRGSQGETLSELNGSTGRVEATFSLPQSTDPTPVLTLAEDPVDSYLFATDYNGGNVSILNDSSNSLVGTVHVGGTPTGIAFDNLSGEFFVANPGGNDLSVVNGTTGTIDGSVGVGMNPQAVVFDYRDDRVLVGNVGNGISAGNVTVINASALKSVGSVTVGREPGAIAYTPVDDRVTVANGGSSNLSVIDPATAKISATIPLLGGNPVALAYDSRSDTLFSANQVTDNVTVINEVNDHVINNPFVATGPAAIAFDPIGNQVYVASPGSDSLTVISGSSFVVTATLGMGDLPGAVTVDPSNGNVFVVDEGTASLAANVTVLAASTQAVVAHVPLSVGPTGLTVDPGAAAVVAAVPQGNATYFVDPRTGTTNRTTSADDQPQSSAYDPNLGDLFVLNQAGGSLTVLGSTGSLLRTVPLGVSPTALTYDPARRTVFVCDDSAGSVLPVNDSTGALGSPFVVAPSALLSAILFDPGDGDLYVADASGGNVTVLNATSLARVAAVAVGTDPTDLALDPSNDTVFVANQGSGNVSAISGGGTPSVVDSFPAYQAAYVAFDPVTDAVYAIGHTSAELNGENATTYVALGSEVSLGGQFPTGLAVVPVTGQLWIADQSDGAIFEVETRAPVNVTNYTITFSEIGLPSGTPWSVDLNGTTVHSATPTILFTVVAGIYPFTIPSASGETPVPPTGVANASLGNTTVDVTFFVPNPPTYTVAFTQTTLPARTAWSVTVGDLSLASNATMFGNGSSIDFTEPNGSYNYTIGTVSGYTSSPSSSPFPVHGTNVSFGITFTAVTTVQPLTASLSENVSTIFLGGSVNFSASAAGGVGPYTYRYFLPIGCASANATFVICRPGDVGNFTVNVTVTDWRGIHQNASTHLRVQPTPSPNHGPPPRSNTSAGTPTWEYLALGLGLLAVIVAIAAVMLARRRRPDEAPVEEEAGPPAD